jgi:hypothetical protein
MEALHQARFANPRLADDQRHLAFTIMNATPEIAAAIKQVNLDVG